MELKVQHLSYSSISLFNRCPREWLLRYYYNINTPATPALAFGTAMHRTIQDALVHGGLTDENVAKFEDNLVATAASSSIRMFTRDRIQLVITANGILFDPAIRMLINSIKVSTPEQVEVKLTYEVPGVPLPVVGYVDIIDDDGHPYDIKTSKWDWYDGRADDEVQPDFYLTGLDLAGDHRHGGKFSHLILVKKPDAPGGYMMDTTRDDYQARTFKLVQDTWAGIQREDWKEKVVREACANCKLKAPCYYNK